VLGDIERQTGVDGTRAKPGLLEQLGHVLVDDRVDAGREELHADERPKHDLPALVRQRAQHDSGGGADRRSGDGHLVAAEPGEGAVDRPVEYRVQR